MAVTLRLVRLGRRNRAFFRLRASDERFATTGRFLEDLGFVDPVLKDTGKQVNIKMERVQHWITKGAKVSETVKRLLAKQGAAQSAKA